MPIRNGEQFLEGLRDGREVWLEGERVADVTTHPKLSRMARTLADIYDLQADPGLGDEMTFESPTSGDPVPLSLMIPETPDDLLKRRRALELVAEACFGMLGRTPDYVNLAVTGIRQRAGFCGRKEKRFADNIVAYHEYVRENDLCLTHTFGHAQVNRSPVAPDGSDRYVPLSIVDETSEGVVVRGAKLLATLAPFSDEIFAPLFFPLRPEPDQEKYCIGFAIPSDTPGLKFICRESYDVGRSLYDYPLSGQYDEMDAMAVLDDVLIPWERVFAYKDIELANAAITQVPMWRQFTHQIAVKNVAKLEFILGIVYSIVEARGTGGVSHVQEKVAEVVDTLEMMRSLLRAAEADAGPIEDAEGIWPAPEPWTVMRHWYPDAYVRVIWIVEQLSSSALMLTPTERDFEGPLASTIEEYYRGVTTDAPDRVRLFRLAWDLVGTQFGSRQALYERFFNGDITVAKQRRYATYDYTRSLEAVRSFFERCDRREADAGVNTTS